MGIWAKQDEPIDKDISKYKIVQIEDKQNMEITADIIIINIIDDDFTSYGCFASNELGSDYRTILVVEKSDYTVTITLIVNISVVVFILFILLIICLKKRITNVEQMEEEKMRNSNYMRHP